MKGEGVQKELLALIEGTTVNTDHGMVHTDHMLFIAAGAFHFAKPSDLLPELQGRLPIRVELEPLSEDDFIQILTKTEVNLIKQQQALFGAEGVNTYKHTTFSFVFCVCFSNLNATHRISLLRSNRCLKKKYKNACKTSRHTQTHRNK